MNDFLLDMDGDILLPLKRGSSDEQHKEHLLVLEKGELKENPISTVGLYHFINGDESDGLANEVALRFSNDGMSVVQVEYDELNGNLNYDANYKS